ncbi:MAG: DUF2155 domain-containing protein [Alphaproteobacteria bacterium TMED89]|nr:hypothetical protein [Rhodospirillaceae bacterium]RPH18849.1 MAG: DUF2155 domain-containing protein [Alphaproteobacteria bacterium TMED89]
MALFRSLMAAGSASLLMIAAHAAAQLAFETPPIPQERPTVEAAAIDDALGDLIRPAASQGEPLFGSFIGVVRILSAQGSPRETIDIGAEIGSEAVTAIQADDPIVHDIAVLRTLDKITARMATEEVFIDDVIELGNLLVKPRRCLKNPPTETPESSAFLEIYEVPKETEPEPVFQGWMFASSPALNAMEHPVFDVWLLDCKN